MKYPYLQARLNDSSAPCALYEYSNDAELTVARRKIAERMKGHPAAFTVYRVLAENSVVGDEQKADF